MVCISKPKRTEVLDAGHNGEKLSSIDTGDDDLRPPRLTGCSRSEEVVGFLGKAYPAHIQDVSDEVQRTRRCCRSRAEHLGANGSIAVIALYRPLSTGKASDAVEDAVFTDLQGRRTGSIRVSPRPSDLWTLSEACGVDQVIHSKGYRNNQSVGNVGGCRSRQTDRAEKPMHRARRGGWIQKPGMA